MSLIGNYHLIALLLILIDALDLKINYIFKDPRRNDQLNNGEWDNNCTWTLFNQWPMTDNLLWKKSWKIIEF